MESNIRFISMGCLLCLTLIFSTLAFGEECTKPSRGSKDSDLLKTLSLSSANLGYTACLMITGDKGTELVNEASLSQAINEWKKQVEITTTQIGQVLDSGELQDFTYFTSKFVQGVEGKLTGYKNAFHSQDAMGKPTLQLPEIKTFTSDRFEDIGKLFLDNTFPADSTDLKEARFTLEGVNKNGRDTKCKNVSKLADSVTDPCTVLFT